MTVRVLALLPLLLLPAFQAGSLPAQGEPPELIGLLTREEVVEALPDWGEAVSAAEPDAAAARALVSSGSGSRLIVYLGTWCPDSRREVSRFWRALDEGGNEPAFDVLYLGVDRSKKMPAELLQGVDLRYVPTFVVERNGRELGRVVESAATAIEGDLLRLLTGEAEGLLTARDDLTPSIAPEHDP